MTRAERHKSRVAALGCILCRWLGYARDTPAHVHHIKFQQYSDRASDFLVIPLCPEHHQGKTGFHGMGSKAFHRVYGKSELDLLADTIELLTP